MFSYTDDDDLLYVRQVAPRRFVVFFLVFFVIGQGLQWLTKNNVRRKHQPLVLDLAATFSLYGCTVGCNYIHRIYGPTWYLMAIASVGIGHALLLCPGVTANPVTHVVSCITCDTPIQKLVMRFVVHVTGSLVCHPLATLLWETLMADQGLDPEMHCIGHKVKGQSVHLAMVLGMELLGTLSVSLVMMGTCQLAIDIYETAAKVFIGCLVHGAGVRIPAVYLNPVLASTQLLGCSDADVARHIMVYWIGPLIGASMAVCSTLYSQATKRKLCRPCVTFDVCPSAEASQPCQPSDNDKNCEICDSKSRSNSSRPCRCPLEEDNDSEGECCDDVEPSACRPSGCGITAQVRQTAVNGSKQLAYLFDIPPTVCRKGLRLRHNILVTRKPKCESDMVFDNWKDSMRSDWRNCSPFPTSLRDTSPEFQSEDWRRSCFEGRDRSGSPASDPDGDCMLDSLSRGQSRASNACGIRKPQRRQSKHDPRKKSSRHPVADKRSKHSEHGHHHAKHSTRTSPSRRHSVRKGDSRRPSPKASDSKESLKKGHSRHTVAGKKSHVASKHSRAGAKESHVSQAAVGHTKSAARATPSKRSAAGTTHKRPSASASRPA